MLTAALLLAPSAGAGTWPGQNGRIAYEYAGTIWTINPDGTDAQELVTIRTVAGTRHGLPTAIGSLSNPSETPSWTST